MTFNPTWKDDEFCHGEGEPPDDEPDYDPSYHPGHGDPGFPPGNFTKGADGKSPSDLISEILKSESV
jgi:hypothetical protein